MFYGNYRLLMHIKYSAFLISTQLKYISHVYRFWKELKMFK